jgi:predicted nucleotidyltransferase
LVAIDPDIQKSLDRFIQEIKKDLQLEAVYLYGSYAKGKARSWSDIDIAVVARNIQTDIFDERVRLLTLAAEIDDRLEPHPFRLENFDETDPIVHEILRTGIRVA